MAIAVLLQGCGGAHARKQSYQFDSATNACRHQPASCAQAAGQEAVLPSAVRTFATAGGSAVAAVKLLDATSKQEVTKALEECANKARTQVILERFGGRIPTPDECRKPIGPDARAITLAMQLGEEMHRIALQCAAERLQDLRPGGFSIEPTYRYDRSTDTTRWVTQEEIELLRRQGNLGELKGTLIPDVVLHSGNPVQAQAVFDFKFPCVDLTQHGRWREYPPGHPFAGIRQDVMYKQALKVRWIAQVAPWIGASP
ncbi:hypothetical protein D7V97_30820 [Corallococcus sp. CA053C]|nr:hypothetical protein D7V97_30820 [Corallococcus sp. CA053C]